MPESRKPPRYQIFVLDSTLLLRLRAAIAPKEGEGAGRPARRGDQNRSPPTPAT